MSIQIKAGAKLRSAVCDTQIMTLRVPPRPLEIAIGGAPALLGDEAASGATIDPALSGGTLTGKRYVDEGETMEFLCTKGGAGTISVDGAPLQVKVPKALPSSD
jgi:hypothetical protein